MAMATVYIPDELMRNWKQTFPNKIRPLSTLIQKAMQQELDKNRRTERIPY